MLLKNCNFFVYFFTKFCLISVCILCRKNTNQVLKYSVFIKTTKIPKKFVKKRKIFLCIRPSVSKLKNHIVFFSYTKIQCFSMHFDFNKQFIKVKRTLAKISKTTKILFCLSFSIRGTTLHVIRILDIKLFFRTLERLGFIPLR